VVPGDFNETVYRILDAGTIGEKTATFALLDQRTFECEWRTVVALSKHKRQTKIELFYFFPTGWIDRSLGALRAEDTIAKVERWWGRPDWSELRGVDGTIWAKMVAKRFEDELGYGKANVYPIHSERRGGRVMYHMIHATDHCEASPLMIRAYIIEKPLDERILMKESRWISTSYGVASSPMRIRFHLGGRVRGGFPSSPSGPIGALGGGVYGQFPPARLGQCIAGLPSFHSHDLAQLHLDAVLGFPLIEEKIIFTEKTKIEKG
jgi:hypothetical protein